QVDVVQVAVGQELQLTAGQIVDGESGVLVGADHDARARRGRVDTDDHVVSRVARTWNGRRLDRRDDAGDLRGYRRRHAQSECRRRGPNTRIPHSSLPVDECSPSWQYMVDHASVE